MTCKFSVNREELLNYLKSLYKIVKSNRKRDTVLEVTLTNDGIWMSRTPRSIKAVAD
jgi:hypothetical protein